ncbi:MAG: chemotaxis response regulator protein-glutamate methylesterase [Peptococcaceae bacterium]|nr:chemotaxis response regulator protein-glutamate methylesterase [Peptococcaceae bacterium]
MPIKILVVDDSSLMRLKIMHSLEQEPDFKVIDTASDGEEAIRKIKALRPDVVTLDVEMPVLDGLGTLKRVMSENPVPVVMLSALTTQGARHTMQALALGAVDFVAKPAKIGEMQAMVEDLVVKIRAAAQASIKKQQLDKPGITKPGLQSGANEFSSSTRSVAKLGKIDLLVIGSSTGGPAALQQIIPLLPADLPVGVVIVQHIPVGFSNAMAEHLNRRSKLAVKHAEQGDIIRPGLVLVAPASYDLTFRGSSGSYSVNLDSGKEPPKPGSFRPSVDLVMNSAAELMRGQVMGVLLTGMGRDGAKGMMAIKEKGGYTVAEAESTCVVFGMPKAAIELGAVKKILPLNEIAGEIVRSV